MQSHITDLSAAIDLGVRTALLNRQIDGDGPRPVRPAVSSAPAGPTPAQLVTEATKDGHVSSRERTLFEKGANATQVKDEQKRLRDAVVRTNGADLARSDDGSVKTNRSGMPLRRGVIDTDHEKLVRDLKRTPSVKELDEQLAVLKDAGATAGVPAIERQRTDRLAKETTVAAAAKDKRALVGVLQAEKVALEGSRPADAADDFQPLRERAAAALTRFNANGGQVYEGNDLLGDDWDTRKVSFDDLARRFSNDPGKLAEFARTQGETDGAGGRSDESMNAHIAKLAERDPKHATRVALRYEAAKELQEVFRDYTVAKEAVVGADDRIRSIDAEVKYLGEEIDKDFAVLSSGVRSDWDAATRSDESALPKATSAEPTTAGTPGSSNGTDAGTAPGTGTDGAPDTSTDGATPATDTPTTGAPTSDTPTSETPSVPAPPTPATTTTQRPIDYAAPANRTAVLAAATSKGLLPEGATFTAEGAASYTVKPGDSYWAVSARASGGDRVDRELFSATLAANVERLGRQSNPALIHPGEQLVLPGRSVADIVRLLQLPTTEQVAVEPEVEPVDPPRTRDPRSGE